MSNNRIDIFDSKLFEAINQTEKSVRGEFEITDSIEILIKNGAKIRGYDLSKFFWSDIGLPWQLLDANQFIIGKMEGAIDGVIEENVYIKGKVYVGKNSRIMSGTYIEGPVFIGQGSIIGPNSYLRPFACIGDNCRVGNSSEIKNSIIMSNSNIPHFNYVGDSVIGSGVNLGAGTKIANLKLTETTIKVKIEDEIVDTKRRKLGTIIGDNVKTGISANIICGVKIGNDSLIGANTLVNEDIPPGSVFYVDFRKDFIKKQRK